MEQSVQLLQQILLALRDEGKTGKYVMARKDETDPNNLYYGFLSNRAEWYLMVIQNTGSILYYNEDKKSFTPPQLLVNFTTAWTNRTSTTFVEFPLCQLT